MPLTRCIALAALLRAILLIYGVFQDRTPLKYTDIDYFVFTDAARYVADGDSPFRRETYRYTPLLAWILTPNIWLFHSWGKILFAGFDLAAGWLVAKLLEKRGMDSGRATWRYASLILLNPFIATISTRGSAEAVVNFLVIATFYLLLERRTELAAVFFGIAVHFKIYPILYALPILVVLDEDYVGVGKGPEVAGSASVEATKSTEPEPSPKVKQRQRSKKVTTDTSAAEDSDAIELAAKRNSKAPGSNDKEMIMATDASRSLDGSRNWNFLRLVNKQRVMFGIVSAGIFFALNGLMYWMYGHEFLSESLLYHIGRKDHRHNFSVYFYSIYLDYDRLSTIGSMLPFVTQLGLAAVLGFKFGKDPGYAAFLQTVAFVAFNKVSTSQYFVWYLALLPFALQFVDLYRHRRAAIGTLAAWVATQALWLWRAYQLELLGENTFRSVFVSGLAFFWAHIGVLLFFLLHGRTKPWFKRGVIVPAFS